MDQCKSFFFLLPAAVIADIEIIMGILFFFVYICNTHKPQHLANLIYFIYRYIFKQKRMEKTAKTSHLGVFLHFYNNSNNLPLLYYHWCLEGLHRDYSVGFSLNSFFLYIVYIYVCGGGLINLFSGEEKQAVSEHSL